MFYQKYISNTPIVVALTMLLSLNPFSVTHLSAADQDMWVDVEQLSRRTCPSTDCGVVGWFIEDERVSVFEERSGWVRVSKYYNAACVSGKSEYVDKGDERCVPENGIVDGEFAEWVAKKHLVASKPVKHAVFNSQLEKAISGSDNFKRYKDAFLEISNELVEQNRCNISDYTENGGWIKATGENSSKPIYFTYCGGFSKNNKVYIDVGTGNVLN